MTTVHRLQNAVLEVTPSSAAAAAVQPALHGRSKEKGKKQVVVDAAAAAAAAVSAASAEFEAAKISMEKLKAKALLEVCQLKNAPPAVRQLLHAACAALGAYVFVCVCGGGGGSWGVMVNFPQFYFVSPGESSHVLPSACLQCMSASNCQRRLASLQLTSINAAVAGDFLLHMDGYSPVEVVGPAGRSGLRALHALCTALVKLLENMKRLEKVNVEEAQDQCQCQPTPPAALLLQPSSLPDSTEAAESCGDGQLQVRLNC